jgi:6-phosphogluconolactonase (cycloisomerase 2 family)
MTEKELHMKTAAMALVIGALMTSAATADDLARNDGFAKRHAVFVMTNAADDNEVIAYERSPYGTLDSPQRYSTGGRGSGGTVDPLASQGSLTLSEDGSALFAVNAGSGTVSLFRVLGSHLALTDRVTTGGSEPNAVAQHGKLVYVLNTAGSASVVGFRWDEGQLIRIADSLRFLSGNFVDSASLAFSGDGRYLVVTERTTNNIDVFSVLADGTLSPIKVNASPGAGAFSVAFAANGALLVSETGGGGGSAISSYSIVSDGALLPVSQSVPTLGAANCWNVVTPDGRFVYASNAGTSSIAGFAIGANGTLTPLAGTVVGVNPPGSANLDIAVSSDGRFLYSLNAGSGTVGMFEIRPNDGQLLNLGVLPGLPAAAGLNGIAAN